MSTTVVTSLKYCDCDVILLCRCNAKGPWPTTVKLHGGLEKMVCTKCGHLEPLNASLFEGPEPPLCEKCKEQDELRTAFAGKRSHGIGRLRPRIVLYTRTRVLRSEAFYARR